MLAINYFKLHMQMFCYETNLITKGSKVAFPFTVLQIRSIKNV
jgi:hypothetical protein